MCLSLVDSPFKMKWLMLWSASYLILEISEVLHGPGFAHLVEVCNRTGYYRVPKPAHPENRVGNRFPLKPVKFRVIIHLKTNSWTGFGTGFRTGFVSWGPKPFFFPWFLFLLSQSHGVFSLDSFKHARHSSFVISLPHLLLSLIGSLLHCRMDRRCLSPPNSCVSYGLACLISFL